MMIPPMFDSIALEVWYSDEERDSLLQTELENYSRIIPTAFH